MNYFNNIFNNKKIIVLGHTGFKGSWLTLWLTRLGAEVVGGSLGLPTEPSHYESINLNELCESKTIDIRNREELCSLFKATEPDFVFHLAAQALVGPSYNDPVLTFETNTLGTLNVLESLRSLNTPVTALLVTSDKAYENVETVQGYRETDRLGGKDPYSASKGAAELVIHGYFHSFLSESDSNIKLVIGRAGNVIGGGDWAQGRLVPDIVRAWSGGNTLEIRSPHSTRPWQHVLEPLSGYLNLAALAASDPDLHGEPFNFGPHSEDVATVGEVVERFSASLEGLKFNIVDQRLGGSFHEAGLLKLSCDKAQHKLDWLPVLTLDEALERTSRWYQKFYTESGEVRSFSGSQIDEYCKLAKERGRLWAN